MESESCAICLQSSENLEIINKEEENWLETLKKIAPEIEWYEFYQICSECVDQIETIHKFRQICMGKEPERQKRMNPTREYRFDVKFESDHQPDHRNENEDEEDEKITITLIEMDPEINQEQPKSLKKRPETASPQTKHHAEADEAKPFKCDQCRSKFRHKIQLQRHELRMHLHDNPTHECTVCEQCFKTEKSLIYHKRIHKNPPGTKFDCAECGKTFSKSCNFRLHRLSAHTNPKLWRFQCEFCSKQFPMKGALEQHVKRHRGDKDFKCDSCPMACVSKGDLKKHMLSHEKASRFSCDLCEKRFKHKKYHELHLARVHKVGEVEVPVREKTHACHLCPRVFGYRYHLHKHVKVHRDHDRDRCDVCLELFRNIRDLDGDQKVVGT